MNRGPRRRTCGDMGEAGPRGRPDPPTSAATAAACRPAPPQTPPRPPPPSTPLLIGARAHDHAAAVRPSVANPHAQHLAPPLGIPDDPGTGQVDGEQGDPPVALVPTDRRPAPRRKGCDLAPIELRLAPGADRRGILDGGPLGADTRPLAGGVPPLRPGRPAVRRERGPGDGDLDGGGGD